MIKYHANINHGEPEWIAARRGLLTSSEMKLIITPKKLEYSSTDKEKAHLYELAAQRITGHVEPQYWSDDMMRGLSDEVEAKMLYSRHYAPVTDMGFVTNDNYGYTIGCSPDGLVGDDGMIECKSRRQKFQTETIITDEVPEEYRLQCQTSLLVTERKWLDFVSYSNGMPLYVKRVLPDEKYREAIVKAATLFYEKLRFMIEKYEENHAKFHPTERRIEEELVI